MSIIQTQLFIFYLIPTAAISGPFLGDTLLVLISLIFIIFNFQTFISYLKFWTTKIFFIFWFFILMRSLFAENIFLSLESSLFYFRFFIFSLVIFFFLESKILNFKYLILSLAIPIFVLFIDSSLQFFTGSNIFGWETPSSGRISSLFGKELKMGSYISRIFPILILSLYVYFNQKKFQLSFIIVIFVSFYLIVISGERTALFNIILFLIIFILANKQYRLLITIITLISLFLSTFIILKNENLSNRAILTIEQTGIGTDNIRFFSDQHEAHYLSALKMFVDKPIFGHGVKMFRDLCDFDIYKVEQGCASHPHNIYLQFLSETGVIGSMFLLFFYIFIFKDFILLLNSNYPNKTQFFIVLTIIIVNFFPFIPSGNFFNNWNSLIYYLPIGFYLFFKKDFNKYLNETKK